MADTFNLPVEFNGTEAEYPAQILRYGFTNKILVTVKGIPVTFEADEEGSYRAVIDPAITEQIPKGLLQAISETLIVLFE